MVGFSAKPSRMIILLLSAFVSMSLCTFATSFSFASTLCAVVQEGNGTRTWTCPDGDVCVRDKSKNPHVSGYLCKPGPEKLAKQAAEQKALDEKHNEAYKQKLNAENEKYIREVQAADRRRAETNPFAKERLQPQANPFASSSNCGSTITGPNMPANAPFNCSNGSGRAVFGSHTLPPLNPAQNNASSKIKDGWSKIANSFLDNLDQGVALNVAMQTAMNQLYTDPNVSALAYSDFLNCPSGGDCLKNVLKSLKDFSHGDNKDNKNVAHAAVPSKPQGTAKEPPLSTAGNKYCEPDLDNPEVMGEKRWGPSMGDRKICWLKASNGKCRKWREDAGGKVLQVEPTFLEDAGLSDSIYNSTVYDQPCPDGATKNYDHATVKGLKP